MRRIKQIAALCLACFVLLFAVFSAFDLVLAAGHDCVGAHCSVCAQLTAVRNLLRLAVPFALCVRAAAAFLQKTDGLFSARQVDEVRTPVSLKVCLIR